MPGLILALTFLWQAAPAQEGRLVRLNGNGFSFRILEPSDWKLDLRSAPQLASFILHPAGVDWRRATTVIYANFLPAEGRSLPEFLKVDRERFLDECPSAQEVSDEPGPRSVGIFMLQSYRCPGVRDEVMAAARLSEFYFILLLTTQEEGALEKTMPVFEKVVSTFWWQKRE